MKRFAVLPVALALTSTLWAGREFTARPGEEIVPSQLLVRYKAGTTRAAAAAAVIPGVQLQPIGDGLTYLVVLPPGTPASYSTQLSNQPTVDYVEPNRIRHSTLQPPNDPSYSFQWGLTNTRALQAWQILPNVYLTGATATAARIKIAVLDTGADCTHPDFLNSGGSSTDAAAGGQLLFSLSQAPVATTITSPACSWQDDHGHGTHVSGIIAAAANNTTGVASLGYPLEIVTYKVLDFTGSGFDSTIASAIRSAADAGVQVVSMSLGAFGYSQTLQDAITYAWQKNVLVVAAAGNDAANEVFFPAGANYALGVAATDQFDSRASFSNFGPAIDIAAPGINIYSTLPTYPNSFGLNYGSLQGTSMATPFVSALAGLIHMSTANLSAPVVAQRIQQSADSTLPNGGWEQNLGYGRINAWRALSGNLRSATVGGIVGQAVDEARLPVTGITVMVNGQSIITDSSLNGLFRFSNFNPGAYTLTASGGGFTTVTMKVVVVAGADTTIKVVMGTSTGEFRGLVGDAGVPQAGTVVQVVQSGMVQNWAITDATGAYSLLVPAGSYDLRATSMFGVTTTVTSRNVTAGGITVVDISIARMGSISIQVMDTGMTPISGADVSVSGATYSAGAPAVGSGLYATIPVPAGAYSVTAVAPGFQSATVTGVTVNNDAVTSVNVHLVPFGAIPATITTSPPGLNITVDGTSYVSPQTFSWVPGSTHTLAVSSPQNLGSSLYAWSNWSDGGASTHTVIAPGSPASYTARFNLVASVQLTNLTRPGSTGNFEVGDSWKLSVTGAPNQPVSFTFTHNGVPGGPLTLGQTNASGDYSLSAFMPPSVVGSWSETWTVGTIQVSTITFTVSLVGPTVKFANLNRPGVMAFQVGENWRLTVIGGPSQAVGLTGTVNGVTGPFIPLGQTDASGFWSLDGTMCVACVGTWSEVWRLGDAILSPTIVFTVSP